MVWEKARGLNGQMKIKSIDIKMAHQSREEQDGNPACLPLEAFGGFGSTIVQNFIRLQSGGRSSGEFPTN